MKKILFILIMAFFPVFINAQWDKGNKKATTIILKDALKPGHYEYIEVSLYENLKTINIKIFRGGVQIPHVIQGADVENLVNALNDWYKEFKNMKEIDSDGYYIYTDSRKKK